MYKSKAIQTFSMKSSNLWNCYKDGVDGNENKTDFIFTLNNGKTAKSKSLECK